MDISNYEYQFDIEQVLMELDVIPCLSSNEKISIARMVKKNLEQSTRTLIAVKDDKIISMQLDVGLAMTTLIDREFQTANVIYLATTDRNNVYKARLAPIPYKVAKRKSEELDVPATRSIVKNLIQNQLGKVAVNKFTILSYKNRFLEQGNIVMSKLIDKAMANNEF